AAGGGERRAGVVTVARRRAADLDVVARRGRAVEDAARGPDLRDLRTSAGPRAADDDAEHAGGVRRRRYDRLRWRARQLDELVDGRARRRVVRHLGREGTRR